MAATKLTLHAQHTTMAVPDVATLHLGVEVVAAKAEQASAANAELVRKVLTVLKDEAVAGADIRTASVTINARNSPRDQPPLRIIGYEATNTIALTVRDLTRIPVLIEKATAAGANNLSGIKFSLLNSETLLNEARTEALKKAMARANLYAGVAGLKVSHIAEIRDDGAAGNGRIERGPVLSKSEAPPIEAGEIALSVSLQVIFELDKS